MQKINLDASESSDPDEDDLTYTWRVLELNKSDYLCEPNRNAEAVKTTLQFFVSGEYTVELLLFDGALFSEPERQTLVVQSQRPR